MDICIYADEGVSPLSLRHCVKGLKEVTSLPIRRVDSLYLTHANWENETALLLFPGGRDIPYQQKLQGIAIQRIKNYVTQGGRYFGICAGAYFASGMIEFEMGGELEVAAARDLAFYPGIARGPVFGNNLFCYNSERGAREALVRFRDETYAVYFNGGCAFIDAHKYSGVEVLATYSELVSSPAAIVRASLGNGFAVLAGVHPEYAERSELWAILVQELCDRNSGEK